MFYYTNDSYVDVPQYVHFDVPSDYLTYWMFYYTHHSHTDAHQYVHADVTSDSLRSWMFYYTHHSYMEAHQYVYVYVPSEHQVPECYITHITALQTFTSMYTVMWLQIT